MRSAEQEADEWRAASFHWAERAKEAEAEIAKLRAQLAEAERLLAKHADIFVRSDDV